MRVLRSLGQHETSARARGDGEWGRRRRGSYGG